MTRLIEKVRPSIYVKGGDYTPATLDPEERVALEKIGTAIRIVPFEPGHSTSGLIERMKKLPSPMRRIAIGILGSGKGSNCRAILEQIRAQKLAADARVIVSDVFDAGILEIARDFGVPNATAAGQISHPIRTRGGD